MKTPQTELDQPFTTEIVDLPATGQELSLVDVIAFLLRNKKLIVSTTVVVTVAGALAVFLLPPSYKAEATILPPQQAQSSLAALASGAMGGLAASSMASQLGLKNPDDLYIGILKSRTISDAIIEHFHLRQVYDKNRASDTRKALARHASFTSGKDTLITISVTDHDPRRAAEMANAFVDELHDENSRLALTDASQRRLFFERELKAEKDALADAEVALKATQQATGLVVPSGQAEALIRSAAQLRAEIASREVELKATQTYATDQNPKIEVLRREIATLQSQLAQIEANGSGSKLEVTGGKLPEAGLEYVRKLRDVKYHETLFELLAKQYEAARLDEAKDAPVIQVVDRATPPDRPARTSRALVLACCMLLGAGAGAAIAYALERIREIRQQLAPLSASEPSGIAAA